MRKPLNNLTLPHDLTKLEISHCARRRDYTFVFKLPHSGARPLALLNGPKILRCLIRTCLAQFRSMRDYLMVSLRAMNLRGEPTTSPWSRPRSFLSRVIATLFRHSFGEGEKRTKGRGEEIKKDKKVYNREMNSRSKKILFTHGVGLPF